MPGKQFQPGQVANPAGRPLGARNRLNKALIEDLYAEWKEGGRDALKIMTTEPRSPLSETEKRAAFLAELEAERARRVQAGKWSGTIRTILMAVRDAGETLRAAQQRAVYEHLADHPDAPKNVSAYNWIVHEIVEPPPAIELPSMQYAADHADALDVTPPSRPPMPPPAAPPLPIEPPRNRALEARLAEERRMRRFMDDDWKPHDGPLCYPRGNRQGW